MYLRNVHEDHALDFVWQGQKACHDGGQADEIAEFAKRSPTIFGLAGRD